MFRVYLWFMKTKDKEVLQVNVPPIKTKGLFFFFLTNLGTFKALQWQNTNSTEAHYESILRVPIMD